MVLYSDRAIDAQTARRHPLLVTHAFGTARDNLAILRFATRPLPSSPLTSEVLVELANFGTKEITTNLEIRYDDRLLDVKPVTLAAGALQKKKIIEYTHGAVKVLNRKKLEGAACECYSAIQQFNGEMMLKPQAIPGGGD